MGFDSKYFSEAENELSDIRLRNSEILDRRAEEISVKLPEIAELRRELSGTLGKLIAIITERADDAREKISALEKENLALQERIRTVLIKNGYPSDYLSPIYNCKLCRDTGIVDDRYCSCFMDIVKRRAAEKLNSTTPLKLCTFDDFSLAYYDDTLPTELGPTARKVMAANLETCRRYAENFHLPYKSLIMRGKTGLGKTHLSLSIASEVLNRGYNVIYGSVPDLLRKLDKEKFEGGEVLDMLETADLLILDDLGAEMDNKLYVSVLYSLINARMNASLPTVINTNLTIKELEKKYDERLGSRFLTMEELIFTGSDVRVQKGAE